MTETVRDLSHKMVRELATSQRIVRDGADVVPRFRIFAPDDEHVAFVQLPEDPRARLDRLNVMRFYMIYKAATGFILSTELITPNVLFVAAVTRTERVAAMQGIKRNPVAFEDIQWVPPDCIDDVIVGLLPPKTLEITNEDLEFMRLAFDEGELEGIRLAEARKVIAQHPRTQTETMK